MRLFLAIIIVVTFMAPAIAMAAAIPVLPGKALPLRVKNNSQSGAGVPNGLNKPDTDHHD